MLVAAWLMIAAATERKESRGVHYRRDYPQADPGMNHHINLRGMLENLDEKRIAGTKSR